MKTLIRNKYVEVSFIKAIALGIGYNDQALTVLIGCLAVEIQLWAFTPRNNKPIQF